uniref:Reverse transcriptase domain-containing protein n=1 Tax=Cannabis sativa TaxID=3483 RepID=A0A803QH07_CANSA
MKIGDQIVAKLDRDEVECEASLWKNSIVCIVLGANPAFRVFEGLIKSVWGNLVVERIPRMNSGFTLVSFSDEETRDLIFETVVIHFDKKLVILRPWTTDIDSARMVKSVPVWVRLNGLNLQHWGKKSLSALVSTIGKPIMVDKRKKGNEEQKMKASVSEKVVPSVEKNILVGDIMDNSCCLTEAGSEKGGNEKQVMGNWSQIPLIIHGSLQHNGMEWLKCSAFYLIAVYGSIISSERKILFEKLAGLGVLTKPWIILGDFNAMFCFQDRNGGKQFLAKYIEDAQTWLSLGQVEEIKGSGAYFTWYCNHWSIHNDFRERAISCWYRYSDSKNIADLVSMLLRMKHVLKRFNREEVGDVVMRYKQSKADFVSAQENLAKDPSNSILHQIENSKGLEYAAAKIQYSCFLRQQSKVSRLQNGEDNTSREASSPASSPITMKDNGSFEDLRPWGFEARGVPPTAMKIVSWNARGLGNPSAVRKLRLLVKEQTPAVLFVMETKLACNSISRFRNILHFSHGLEVPRVGLSGGLMLLWNDEAVVTLNNFNTNMFDCYLGFLNGPLCHFTAFYGAPATHNRIHSWTLLKRLKDVAPMLPWMIIGDFNEILYNCNKQGGSLRRESQMEEFRSVLDFCNLTELHFTGEPFTWTKNRNQVETIQERLDWCFTNDLWVTHFQPLSTSHLDFYSSDHRAIAVNILPLNLHQQQTVRKTRFRFEKMWLKEEEAAALIKDNWKFVASGDITHFQTNLSTCTDALQRWHHHKFGQMKKDISKMQKTVAQLNNMADRTQAGVTQLQQSEKILDELLANEEEYWHQRSRVDWLQCGDKNTKFFHAKASSRKANNTIKSLTNDLGLTVTGKENLTQVICSYYEKLFASEDVHSDSLQHVINAIPSTIDSAMNQSLTAPFSGAEVYAALQSMSPDKSPGSDGMSAMFYQNYWDIVGSSVTQLVLGILNDGNEMTQLNNSIITLIPKVPNPSGMCDYRPISLCNVIYKLISKTIVLRFQKVLPFVISETQSAFLSNRLITDNILVAFELIHHLRHKTQGRIGYSALKLDMSKAFDRVEWNYLEAVMLKMGFAPRWVTLIMSCITTSSFSFSLNGEVVGHVQPYRGLRQGDPLSPYLFLICSEGLSRLLQFEEAEGHLKGLRLTRNAPSVSHLLFADDSLLFCQATEQSALALKRTLATYHKASGQLLNNDKSVMSFSPNTSLAAQTFFAATLQMPITDCHERYLGLPSYSGRDKQELFSNIKEKVWKLLHAWNEKIFSVGGKEVLLKAVVQSIPTYAMSCFKLTKKFCNQLESMMANFWWGTNQNGTKIHWKRWKSLCKSKHEGGMGFRSFVHFNQALLAKQAWRIFDMPDSLLSRLLKHRYFSTTSFLDASIGHSPSYTWQSICWGRELLIKGLRFKVGNGSHIDCSKDPWIPSHDSFRPVSYCGPPQLPVSALINDNREWNSTLLNDFFQPIDVEKILSIPLSYFATQDRLIWHHSTSGSYNVKSGFHLATHLEDQLQSSSSDANRDWWKFFWNLSLPPKIRIFAWKVIQHILPVAAALFKRKVIDSAACSLCNSSWESIGHALFGCSHAKNIWKESKFIIDFNKAQSMFNGDYLHYLSAVYTQEDFELFICLLWGIWTDRNRVFHGGKARISSSIITYTTGFHRDYSRTKHLSSQSTAAAAELSSTHQNSTPQTMHQHTPWTPPNINGFKLNVDAASNSDQQKLGIGAIIRSHDGMVVAALSKVVQGSFRSDEMEAKALFHALNWVSQSQLSITHIETDALRVSTALNSTKSDLSCFSDLIFDIRCLLSFFPSVLVSHAKRSANQAAHGLARFALGLDEDISWVGEIPYPIFTVVVNDLNL